MSLLKKRILSVILAGMMVFTSILSVESPNVYASETVNTTQYIVNDDIHNTVFNVVVTDLDGNLIPSKERGIPVVIGLVGAIKYLFGVNAVYTFSGLVFTVFKSGSVINTVTFVKGIAMNGGIAYTAQIADRIYKFIVTTK